MEVNRRCTADMIEKAPGTNPTDVTEQVEIEFLRTNVQPLRPGKLFLVKLEARVLARLEP